MGKDGLAIALISPELNALVTHSHSTPCERVLFVHLDSLPLNPVGLLNVYGPHSIAERIQLWRAIL